MLPVHNIIHFMAAKLSEPGLGRGRKKRPWREKGKKMRNVRKRRGGGIMLSKHIRVGDPRRGQRLSWPKMGQVACPPGSSPD